MLGYKTIDYLPDLAAYSMIKATRLDLVGIDKSANPSSFWESAAFYNSLNKSGGDTYVISAQAGATYQFISESYFDPYQIIVYDHYGNAIATGGAGSSGTYGSDTLSNFVAPYSGTFYIDPGWNRGSYYTYVSLAVKEDIDTISVKLPGLTDPYRADVPPPALESRIFNGLDVDYYIKFNPEVFSLKIDPLTHYSTSGWKQGLDPNAQFDTSWYLEQNKDVAAAGINPLEHYMNYGWIEGRNPSYFFDGNAYLEQNPDVALAGMNPMDHYMKWGVLEGREWY